MAQLSTKIKKYLEANSINSVNFFLRDCWITHPSWTIYSSDTQPDKIPKNR